MHCPLRRVATTLALCLALVGAVGIGRGPSRAAADTHVVRAGETLWGIAHARGTNEEALRALNPSLRGSSLIRPGQELAVPTERERTHRVEPGDTLGAIAEHHGVSLRALRRANPAVAPRALQVGEELRIPALDATADAGSEPSRIGPGRQALRRLIATPGVQTRPWSAIVVHHSATTSGNAARFERNHREVRGFPRGMAYHFVIGNGRGLGEGEVEAGQRWRRQQPGAHVASRLRDSQTGAPVDNIAIGIVLVGNFEHSRPGRRQRQTLEHLVAELRQRFGIPAERVFGHGEVPGAHTACPGARLDVERLRAD